MPRVLLQTGLGHVLTASLLLYVARVGHRIDPDAGGHPVALWHVLRRHPGPRLLRWEVRVGGLFG